MLMPFDKGYIEELEALAAQVAPGRLRIVPALTPDKIVQEIRKADIGLVLIPPKSTSYLHCLPNKFFESMMAGLALVIGPSPEMQAIGEQGGFVAAAEGFTAEDLADCIRKLSVGDIDRMKKAALESAKEHHAAKEMEKLRALYSQL